MTNFYIGSEIVRTVQDEFGDWGTAFAYFVVAEEADGSRQRHEFLSFDEDKVARLMARIERAGGIQTPAVWGYMPAAYGSAAHQESDWMDDDDRAIQQRGF